MGIMFGGWAREEEDEVNTYYGGDWNKYKEAQQAERLRREEQYKEPEFSESFPRVTVGDMICQWNVEESKTENEFFIQRIIEGQIYGRYIDGRNDNMTEKYTSRQYRKLFSIIEKL